MTDAKPEAAFRCEQWACTLSCSACLKRQVERRRPRQGCEGTVHRFPFCAKACEQGRAIAERFGRPEPFVAHARASMEWGNGT